MSSASVPFRNRLQVGAAERGLVPDAIVRVAIRRLLRARLREQEQAGDAGQQAFRAAMAASPLALVPDEANRQHYEWPPAFFERVLGPRMKYSACLFPTGGESLAEAEEAMLALSCERAGLEDGMRVLDLGCGWGSLSLWIAERLPACRVTAVSNSKLQREFILGRAAARGLQGIEVVTADMNRFDPGRRFDRVISVEMFEHMRNWGLLFARVASWLEPGGRAFLHVFAHRRFAYPYETHGTDDWMGRNFFSGGLMPSEDLLAAFPESLELEARWRVDGTHYQRTAEAWLANLDAKRAGLESLLAAHLGEGETRRALQRWRLFFLACSELFGFRGGREWFVSQARLAPGGAR
jgi:cyclopropane-fatty-acyl-phospholipid synthase